MWRWFLATVVAGEEVFSSLLQSSKIVSHVGPEPIPCIVHQTAKSHELSEDEAVWAETWRSKNPECDYKLWNDTEIAELAQQKSPDLIWPIWDGLSGVERADVFRYLVLYDQGGYYADVDAECSIPIAQYDVPKDVSMLAGYEFGHRFPEWQRVEIRFARTEQFQQWFLASAPQNPVLLRCLQMVRQRFAWKVQSTLELTGPGVFSDAVHEFLQQHSAEGLQEEVRFREKPQKEDVHFLSYPSRASYGTDFKVFLLPAGTVNAAPQVSKDDPAEGATPWVLHHFEGIWKVDKDFEEKELRARQEQQLQKQETPKAEDSVKVKESEAEQSQDSQEGQEVEKGQESEDG